MDEGAFCSEVVIWISVREFEMGSGATSSQEFAAVRKRLEELASAVLEQSRTLRSTFGTSDGKRLEVLARIIAKDAEVDSLELSLDDLTVAFMNYRAPLGRDLRYAIGAIDVAAGLERVGDCVRSIARNMIDIGAIADEMPSIWGVLKDLSEKSNKILEKAVSALLSGDAESAESIPPLDNVVDALQDHAHDLVLKSLRGASGNLDPETGLLVVACANKFESIADIACHIAETVVYIVQGRRIRHGQAPVLSKAWDNKEENG
jgi:phosphate transport system protein